MTGKSGLRLENRAQLSTRLAMRFSNVLEMSEEDASRLSSILEADPLFQKLFRPENPEMKVFSRQRFPGSHLSTSFYEIPEQAQAPASPEIESVLDKHTGLVEKIRSLGVENYEKYFLYEDGEKNISQIAAELNLSPEFVQEIRGLTDQVMMNPDFFAAKTGISSTYKEHYTCLAEYLPPKDRTSTEIAFHSASMALGTYKIDYEKLRKLKENGALNDKEKKTLQETIRMLEMLNSRRSLIYRILMLLPKWQENFFSQNDWDQLVPFAQKSAAIELGVTPAAVCRAIQDRSVIVLGGQEMPLGDFFPSHKDIHKHKIDGFIKENKQKTDAEIRDIIERDFAIKLSRRSVNVYRNEILGKIKKR